MLLSASYRIRIGRRVPVLLALSLATALTAQAQELKVEFTGKLLGYYRLEASAKKTHLKPVDAFLTMRDSKALLVGMGDNFGPEIGGRGENRNTNCVPVGAKAVLGTCDNVANFLEVAGYRAIVPGREDFGDSAPWLRDVARHLREKTTFSNNPDGAINLIAANLRLSISVGGKSVKDTTPLGLASKGCPLFFADSANPADAGPCTIDKSTSVALSSLASQLAYLDTQAAALPSLKREVQETYAMRVRNTALSTETGILLTLLQGANQPGTLVCLTKLKAAADTLATSRVDNPDFDQDIDTRNKLAFMAQYAVGDAAIGQAKTCTPDPNKLRLKLPAFATVCNGTRGIDLDTCVYMQGVLDAFRDEEKEAYRSATGQQQLSITLSPKAIQAGSTSLLRLIAEEEAGIGYVEASSAVAGRKKTLILGVVGKETMQSIRPHNLALCTKPQDGSAAPAHFDWNECPLPNAANGQSWLNGQIKVADPIATVELLLRALDPDGTKYEQRILLAQMPRTEAEEVAAHIHNDIQDGTSRSADLDLVISEAQADHASDDFDSDFPPAETAVARILTPYPPYSPYRADQQVMQNPLSLATIEDKSVKGKTTRHLHHERAVVSVDDKAKTDTLTKLAAAMGTVYGSMNPVTPNVSTKIGCTDHDKVWDDKNQRNACELVLMYRLLDTLRERSHADVALLERRDFFFGPIPSDYDDDGQQSPAESVAEWHLRVAMERVLWKEDAPAEVMVSGKDLAAMMTTSQGLSALPSQPIARDIDQQWLQTAGIVTSVNTASVAGLSAQTFTVSGDPNCHDVVQEAQPSAGGSVMYCVNGSPLLADHAYWIATSDHLAQDGVIYTTMSGEAPHYAGDDRPASLAFTISRVLAPVPDQGKTAIAHLESARQQNPLFQLDFGKLVASYTIQQPSGGDANISQNFQGVTDSTASSASSKSFDFEAQFRVSRDIQNPLKPISIPKRFTVGVQEDFELTGTWTGTLSSTASTPTWSYSANSFTIGPFLQHALAFRFLQLHELGVWYPYDPAQRSLPMLSLVIAPFQYQHNIRSIPLTVSGAASSSATVNTETPWGFSQRAGLRYAFDGGKWYLPDPISYAELGMQYNKLHNVIASLNIDGTLCPSSTETYNQCAQAANLTLSDTTPIEVMTSTQTTWGGYWDINLQKGIGQMWDKSGPSVKLVFESKGDLFNNRGGGKALSSQTRFDVPLSLAMTFPIFRNLTLAPSYQAYLYENQVAGKFLIVHNASFSLRWYMDRDSHVPWGKQLRFIGPSSADQTQASKK